MVQQQQDLRRRLDAMNAEWADAAAREPVQALEAQSENAATLRAALGQQVSSTELEMADTSYAGDAAKQQASARTRLEQLRRQIQALDKEAAERERLIATRLSRRERMESERKAVLAQLTAVETQLREARGGVAYRGERLKLIEPGIVPERPSWPNTPLNIAAALLLGLALPILWLTLRMGYDRQRAAASRGKFHAYARTRDE
jgi:capsule polysaccharide export protein KpsE/RkpR